MLLLASLITLSSLSLEEKVGQLLMPHFYGEIANEEAKTLIQETHVGGIIYYTWANTLSSPEQVRLLSSSLQELSPIPLLISTDQEGGIVARLTNGFTIFPGNKALGMTNDPELAELSAYAIGRELRSVGINMNLAPVADVNSNPKNPLIGIRSFGETPELVCSFAKASLQGFHRAGVMSSLKHFPGHGDPDVDSHYELPVVKRTKAQLEAIDLFPFAKLVKETDTIMTGHLMVPALDPDRCATLSKPILGMLRHEMGFEGVILSDSLVMEGVLKQCSSIDEAAIQAIDAGCDMLILGGKQLIGSSKLELQASDVQRIHASLVEAVKSGRLSMERIDEAAQRVLDLKAKYHLLAENAKISPQNELAQKIASLAIRAISKKPLSCKESSIAVFGPRSLSLEPLCHLGKSNTLTSFELSPTDAERVAALEAAKKAEVLLFCSYNAWKSATQTHLVHDLLKMNKPMILVCLRDPLDADLFPADLVIKTFSPTAPSIEAAAAYITSLMLGSENANVHGKKE